MGIKCLKFILNKYEAVKESKLNLQNTVFILKVLLLKYKQ